jgi:hypothetical protein
VGKLLRGLGSRIGVHVADIAYLNAARCQLVENPPVARDAQIKASVVGLCSREYPVAEVVRLLRPSALVVTKGTYDVAAAALDVNVPVFVVHQRQLCLQSPFAHQSTAHAVGTRINDWSTTLGVLLERARESSGSPPSVGERG